MDNWIAVWGNLVVLPDKIEETDPTLRRAQAAGFVIPESEDKKRMQVGQIEGTLIDFGGNCFEDWKGEIPERGDKIVYDKYAGFEKEINGNTYRIIRDTDIFLIRRQS